LIAPDLFEQETALEHLKGLRELIERMNSVYDLEELLTFVVDKALHLTGGYRGLLLLSNDQARELREIALVRGEEPDDQRLQQALEAASSTVIQDVLARGEPRLVLDLPADRRYEGIASPETLKLKQIRSVLAVPLKVGQEPVGLIYIDHPKKAIFGQSDLYFLTAFANQAAIAIHRAREHQRKIDELTHLNELSRSVVQVLDLDKVLTKIVSAATEMLNVETGSVLLLDEDRAELYFATSVSNGKPVEISTRLRKDQGVGGWVLSSGQPACLNDLAGDPRWYGEVEVDFNTQSLLCVPLQAEQRALGVLQVLNTKKREGFRDEDLALLSAFAASATIAIENAHLFREARQARQLRALNELALGLGKTLELKAILEFGLKQSLRLLEAEAGLISLFYHPGEPSQVAEGLAQEPVLAGAQTKLIQACLDLMAQRDSDELLIIDELQAHPQLSRLDLAGAGFKALALAPLKIGRENKGVLMVMHRTGRSYSEEWLSLLGGIAPIISLAVQTLSIIWRPRSGHSN